MALKLFRELNDRWLTAWTLEGLGGVSHLAGEYRIAVFCFRKSLALFDLLGDKGGALFMLSRLGMTLRAQTQPLRAAVLLGAFSSNREALIGREAARRMERTPDLLEALARCQAEQPRQWARGQAMSYEQAVTYARRIPSGDRPGPSRLTAGGA